MKKNLLLVFIILLLATIGGYLWITRGPQIAVYQIEKVVKADIDPQASMMCANFKLNTTQFNQKFNQAKHIWQLFLDDYMWLPCYYRATIDNKEYRLRAGGLAEVRSADGDVTYFSWDDE